MITPRDVVRDWIVSNNGIFDIGGVASTDLIERIAAAQAEWTEAAEKEGYSKGRLAQLAAQPQPVPSAEVGVNHTRTAIEMLQQTIRDTTARAEAAEAERNALREQLRLANIDAANELAENAALRAEIEALRVGLQWYAEPKNYQIEANTVHNSSGRSFIPVMADYGGTARALLHAKPGEGAALTCEGCVWLRDPVPDAPCGQCKRMEREDFFERAPGEGVKP